MTIQPQPQVGDYSLLAKIGEGGMGVVHLARRPDGERVALKVLRPHIVGDDEARQRLAREVASLSRIRSRWVAEILDADPWAPVPYVATRYVPGLSLHDHVAQKGAIEGDDLLWFAACLAEGLASIHEVGVVHRDIKPSNVLMEGRTPIVIDFGLARVADDPRLTHTGWLLGTPGYLAPEILYGEDATVASDVHSWAATVAFAATGRSPFGRGPSMAIMDRVRRGEHDLSGMQAPLLDVVTAALDPEAGRRPSLGAILAWLRPQTTQPSLALASAPTVVERVGPAGTRLMTTVLPDSAARATYPPPTDVPPPPPPQPWPARPEWHEQPDEPEAPRVPWGERLRRFVVVLAGAVLVGAACTAAPWVALAVLVVAVWLLRSGSIAASRVEARRQVRGRRWYDAPQLLVHAPWHLVQSIPSTIMLLLWSAGLAAAVGLVCYAVTAPLAWSLFGSGVVFALSLWWGPGGSRVRSPLRRLVVPASRSAASWMVTVVVLLALAAALGGWVLANGVAWTPAADVPFMP